MSGEILEKNEASKNSPTEKEISDSATINVEEPEADNQFGKELETAVDEAKNEEYEETNIEEQGEGVTTVNNIEDTSVANMAVGLMEALYGDSSEDEEEDVIWEGDEEDSEGEEEASEEEAIEEHDAENSNKDDEETAVDEDEVSEAEAIEEEDEEHATEDKEIAKRDEGEAEEHNTEKLEVNLKKVVKLNGRREKNKEVEENSRKLASGAKPKSSLKKKVKKRVESMGMIFMCSSKTKNDCFQYRVLGLPQSKKDMVEKIYPGMRLFLYDVNLKLMYGIFKAMGSGGYNIEPKAFKSKFPSQVRFTILDDCLPLAEEKFKNVIKDNYFTKNKFDCQLNSEQVKTLCKLFVSTSKQQQPPPPPKRLRGPRKAETQPLRRESRKAEKQPIRQEIRRVEKQPAFRDRTRKRKTEDRRRPALREETRYLERPRKRQRNLISHAVPLRQPLPAPLPSTIPLLASDAHGRDSYFLESRDPRVSRHDPYVTRRERSVERHDRYRDVVRDPYLEHHDPYLVRRGDPYRDGRDLYLDRWDPYMERRDQYPESRDRLAYIDRRDPFTDDRDSYVRRRDPYKEDPVLETYRRDPVPERRDVYREDRGAAVYYDTYRLDGGLDRVDHQPLGLETSRRYDAARQDPYALYRALPSNADPLYYAEYPSHSGLARVYRL